MSVSYASFYSFNFGFSFPCYQLIITISIIFFHLHVYALCHCFRTCKSQIKTGNCNINSTTYVNYSFQAELKQEYVMLHEDAGQFVQVLAATACCYIRKQPYCIMYMTQRDMTPAVHLALFPFS
jgi:hypothetical protein